MCRYIFILSAIITFASCSSHKETKKESAGKTDSATSYKTASIQEAGVNSSVTLPAQLAAYEEVSIFPKVNGYVKNVHVDIGSKVSKGQMLMTLEAPEMEQSTMQAKEKYMEMLATYAVSKEKYRRLLVAAQTPGAISPFDISSAKAKTDADSALTNAERTAWQMQQTTQNYLQVTAPFSGVITQRNVSPGALVSATDKSTPMLELKDITHLRLQVDVPENVSADLNNNDRLSFTTSAMPGKVMQGVVSRKSMDIESRLRAERIEIDVNNADLKLAPGMYANVILSTKGNAAGFAVPKSAVLTTTEGRYVFIDTGNKSYRKINVSTGNQSTGQIEVYGALKTGEQVVINPDDDLVDEAE